MTARSYDAVVIGGGIVGTYVCRLLTEHGRSVALVERGARHLPERGPSVPELVFPERQHRGALEARNHVLGGNGHFWGGGLIRPEHLTVEDCLGTEVAPGRAKEPLEASFVAAERALGLWRSPARFPGPFRENGERLCDTSEILVLPGRARNVSMTALARIEGMGGCDVYAPAELRRFVRHPAEPRIASIDIEREGDVTTLHGEHFVIAAGVIDSVLLAERHASELGIGAHPLLASHLHDHWSLPMFTMRGRKRGSFDRLAGLRFERGVVVGKRFEAEASGGWRARGYVHFQYLFDEVAPYRQIKAMMNLRQKRAGIGQLLREALRLLVYAPRMARIGFERYFRKRLYVSDDLPIVATLDFESFPSPKNYLRMTDSGKAALHWDVRQDDEHTFFELGEFCRDLVTSVADKHGLIAEPLVDLGNRESARRYLHDKAADTFHLGGGLAASTDASGLLDSDLRLRGLDNLTVLSSAAFARPGLPNPVLTLLALANRHVHDGILAGR